MKKDYTSELRPFPDDPTTRVSLPLGKLAPFFRTPYNYDMMEVSNETGLACLDKTLAQQSSLEETDINTIVMRFGLTGKLPEAVRAPQYGDFVNALDFRSSLEAVGAAQEAFMEMPAHVRRRFHNDPQAFLEFCGDEGNRDEARKLGLLFPEDPKPVPAVVQPSDKPVG